MATICWLWRLQDKDGITPKPKKKGKKYEREFEGNNDKEQSGELVQGKTTFWLSRALSLMFCQMQSLPLSALLQKNVEAGASLAYKWRRQTFLCSIICCKAPHLKVSRELRVLLLGSLSQLGSQLLKKEEKPKQAAALMVISGTFLLSACHWGEV